MRGVKRKVAAGSIQVVQEHLKLKGLLEIGKRMRVHERLSDWCLKRRIWVKARAEVAQAASLVLQSPDRAEAKRRLADFSERFAKTPARRWRAWTKVSRMRWQSWAARAIPQAARQHQYAGAVQ